jgi:hypothetical protein
VSDFDDDRDGTDDDAEAARTVREDGWKDALTKALEERDEARRALVEMAARINELEGHRRTWRKAAQFQEEQNAKLRALLYVTVDATEAKE